MMLKVPKYRKDLTSEEILEIISEGNDFYTLDGYVSEISYNQDSKEYELRSLSYDNDYDETLPEILIGVKNPNETDRKNQKPKKNFFFPRQLERYRYHNIQFWYKRKEILSEVLSRWPQLSIKIKGLGRASATDLICLMTYLNHEGIKLLELPGGNEISEIIIHKCTSHLLEGQWRYLASLIQLANAPMLLDERIHQRLSNRSLFGNFIPKGKKIFQETIQIELTCYPVKYSNRKRGHRDSHSGSSVHITRNEYSEKIGTLESTRDLKVLEGKDLLMQYLWGYSAPVMEVKLSSLESEYRKRLNKQRKQKQKLQDRRARKFTSKVRIIRPGNEKHN